jgi:myo-inositol-1-phosphate synthase
LESTYPNTDKNEFDMPKIAIAGLGNCASALLQSIAAGRKGKLEGVIRQQIGPWQVADIEVVAAFDIDRRKVGLSIGEAAFALPNCVDVFEADLSMFTPTVLMGPVLDGVASHMNEFPDEQTFLVADQVPVDVAAALRASGAEVLVCYLPVGSEQAVRHYAEACLAAGVGLINCVPVFIASDPVWAARFAAAGLPLIGDDIKSQLGATIVHRTLAWLFDMRGISIDRTYQLNTGGNTDFLNMLARDRLESKKISKTGSVQSILGKPIPAGNVHIGPSDYVPWQKDNKICFLRVEGRGIGGAPIELELRLSVQDSPNSAGVVLDAIRCAKLALDKGIGGALIEPSSAFMKTPPKQLHDLEAQQQCDAFIARLS